MGSHGLLFPRQLPIKLEIFYMLQLGPTEMSKMLNETFKLSFFAGGCPCQWPSKVCRMVRVVLMLL